MSTYGVASIAGITVICYLVGMAVKASGIDNKWIPIIVGICGGILGVIGFAIRMPDFPATDYITAIAEGIVSGLASTGANQIGKQMNSTKE